MATEPTKPAVPTEPAPRNRRRELLVAFTDLVLEDGDRAATLDAVAARADVSKGGLLYHFPSREAFISGLCAHLDTLVADDLARMHSSGMTPSEWYLTTSTDYSSELERTIAALQRLAPNSPDEVRRHLVAARQRWFASIYEELGDEQLGLTVMLLGDGIAYNAEIESAEAGTSGFTNPATSDALLEFVRALGLIRGRGRGAAQSQH